MADEIKKVTLIPGREQERLARLEKTRRARAPKRDLRPAAGRNALVQFEADAPKMGPAMEALPLRQRKFVEALLDNGMSNYTRAAAEAGYTGERAVLGRTGSRLAHDDRVQAAIQEEARRRMKASGIMAASMLINMAADPTHKDHFKAVTAVLDRAGLHAQVEHTVTHNHVGNDQEAVQRIVMIAKTLGLDPKTLLGSQGIVVDAEFNLVAEDVPAGEDQDDTEDEIEDDTVEPVEEHSSEGLEDLLS